MKNKIVTAFLGCALAISIGLNVYLLHCVSTARGQVAVFSEKVIVADGQINDLNSQLSDFGDLQEKVSQLEKQLADNESQITTLTNSLSESEAQIESLEAVLAEKQATIASLGQQPQQEAVQQTQQTQQPVVEQPQQPVQQPANPPAGLGNMGLFDSDSSGIGTGAGSAYGEVGTFE